jgi:hypothetical protein
MLCQENKNRFKMKDSKGNKEPHPKQQVLRKFILLCVLFLGYFSYLSYQYNMFETQN